MTSIIPRATSASETYASRFCPLGPSGLGGGKPARAMLAEVQPSHQPPAVNLSLSQLG